MKRISVFRPPVLALHFSRFFISVAMFSQAEFLTEISLFFSPSPKTKGLISIKDFSSPITADCALTPSTQYQQLCATESCLSKTEFLVIYFAPDAWSYGKVSHNKV